jgi:hypothetical protein
MQSAKFQLVIDLRTAKAPGLTAPPSLLPLRPVSNFKPTKLLQAANIPPRKGEGCRDDHALTRQNRRFDHFP